MGYIAVDGLRELQLAVRQVKSKELDKRLGQANKQIGQMVIDRLHPSPDPRATGAGRGALPRPSASKREVLLRMGGAHRASGAHTNLQPWGVKRVARPGTRTPDRPFVQGTAEREIRAIGDAWLEATIAALATAFADSSIR